MMKQRILVFLAIGLFLLLLGTAQADVFRWAKVGNLWARIFDNGHQSETAGTDMAMYYTGGKNPGHTYKDFLRCAGLRFGCANWTDETGKLWPVKLAGAPYGTSDDVLNTFEIPDADGLTIRRYFRYPPPKIQVGDFSLEEPMLEGDEVAPDKIPGTADVFITSHVRNWMGLDIEYKVLAWSQKNHDDYVIWDLTITNTGNIDRDDEIELQGQKITDLYIMRQYEIFPNRSEREWNSWYGARPGDTLRVTYSYPYRQKGKEYDDFGYCNQNTGLIRGPVWGGEAILFIETEPGSGVDDPAQPQMHAVAGPDDLEFKHESGTKGPADWELVYNVMKEGYHHYPKASHPGVTYMEGTYPGTHHDLEPDQRPVKYLNDFDWWFWHAVTMCSMGPYDLEFGESLRLVWALGAGSISPEKAWDVGLAWKDGNCVWPDDTTEPIEDLADYYPAWGRYPDLAPTYNDQAKDRWICTGKDSLFNNLAAAQWAFRNDYNVPIPPPAPNLKITPLPDRIIVEWNYDGFPDIPSDLAGFRVYRAVGAPDYNRTGEVVTGKFTKIAETNASTFAYEDVTAERGKAYFYYVTAFDDGTQNGVDWNGKSGEVLESGHYLNRTTQGAHLTRAPGSSLDDIRVVPNPFNIAADELQWPGENDKIMFMNLPPVCTIKIYTESGDLVKTLEHTNGSGDEPWGVLSQEWSTTETGQIIVSGIYIAHIETPDGASKNVKFLVVR